MIDKKIIVAIVLALVVILAAFFMGCGSSSSSTTTTTVSTELNTAKAGATIGSGSVSVGNTAGGIGTAAGTTVAASSIIQSVGAFESGPPTSFFSVNIRTGSASADGYVQGTSEAAGGNVVPYIRMYTQGGDLIAGTFLNNKKIATLEGVTVQDFMTQSASQAQISTAIQTFATSFLASSDPYNDDDLFFQINTYADYMSWAFIYPGMGAAVGQGVTFTTPEATTANKIGSMECKMVFQNSISGNLIVNIPVSTEGSPLDGAATGSGTLTTTGTPPITIEATAALTFADGEPTNITISGTTVPEGNLLSVTMNANTGIGTGILSDESGTTLGTFESTATGGTFYPADGSAAEEFTL